MTQAKRQPGLLDRFLTATAAAVEGPYAAAAGLLRGPSVADRLVADSAAFREKAGTEGLGAAMRDPALRRSNIDVAQEFNFLGPITAYHGSPHLFDRFTTEKIGSGEGAQAYGHGLYFAENPEVARGYHERLAPESELFIGGKPARDLDLDQHEIFAISRLDRMGQNFNAAKEQVRKAIAEKEAILARAKPGSGLEKNNIPLLEGYKEELAALERFQSQGVERKGGGAFYKVELRPDPEDLLDYDAPLSKQPPKVREALAKAFPQRTFPDGTPAPPPIRDDDSGQLAYATLVDRLGSDVAASQALRAAGIPGLRYLDAGSRAGAEGSRNVVIFGDEGIEVLERNGQPTPAGLLRMKKP